MYKIGADAIVVPFIVPIPLSFFELAKHYRWNRIAARIHQPEGLHSLAITLNIMPGQLPNYFR